MNHRLLAAALATLAAAGSAWAGRPLTVDDANTNDKGAGHVEMWVEHAPGSNVAFVAPAYAPLDGVEFALALSRESQTSTRGVAAQVKWRITPSVEAGCNVGVSLGAAHVDHGGGNARFGNGLLSCNLSGQGSVHVNAGLVKPSGSSSVTTWGIAYERELGPVTPHVEWFGAEGEKPTVQVGLRGRVTDAWQLDGTVGRGNGETVYSLGVKYQF